MIDHGWIAALYCVGFLAESAGAIGVVQAAFRIRSVRDKPVIVNNGDGTLSFQSDQTDALVEAQSLPVWALVALATGIICGFLGNILAL